jgi:predicted SAM-dependent methyltransferase
MNRETEFPLPAGPTPTSDRPCRLHLGCGGRHHPDWLNLDLKPQHPSVARFDVTEPLPFGDQQFDAVYHAHLLEHLPRASALPFLRECHRVLKPGGILRVVVPDLEQIARIYLESVSRAWLGDAEAQRRHAWALMEMYDQVVREQPGGEMLPYLAGAAPADIAWYRLGADGAIIRGHLEHSAPPYTLAGQARWLAWLMGWRERLVRWLLGRDYGLLQIGRFRRAGEVHLWMYDRHSLRAVVTAAGFVDFRRTTADDSAIPGWTTDHLDTQADGTAVKPDSLYAEAVRP